MAIIDILIYVAFAFFASSLAKKSENYIEDNDIAPTHWDKYLTYFVLFFTIIGGIRWMVGNDNISYATIFAFREVDFNTKEKLWAVIVYCFQKLGIHWMFGLALCAFFQIYFITKATQPYRWLLVFIPFVYFGGRYWMDCQNATRQMIVAYGFLWALKFIYERKLGYFLVFVFISSMIHQSALILLPFYFVPKEFDLTGKKWILIGVLLVCVVAGQVAGMSGLSRYVEAIAGATSYEERYGVVMVKMLNSGYDEEALAFGPMMLSYILIPIFIILYGSELKTRYGEKIPYFDLWFNLSFFYACTYFLVCNLGHIFIRPFMYFEPFQMVMAAMLLHYLWVEYKQYGTRQLVTIAFCFVIAVNTGWDVYKASGSKFESSTYKVSFFHSDEVKRFNL